MYKKIVISSIFGISSSIFLYFSYKTGKEISKSRIECLLEKFK